MKNETHVTVRLPRIELVDALTAYKKHYVDDAVAQLQPNPSNTALAILGLQILAGKIKLKESDK
ncbi:hypothetical protein [Thiovibrio frasassiensis]|uniref:Uncharacterized protein n=1 Tax=Thiovibrio frasassiensis TaxID=2984131 RepID=A0A9X4RLH1_9BACT|nr:hypothetical protein [Thiovibrio frasassiensis]MDG4475370.1 hypothetical protein [Thiovibrio frasassiensis]